MPYFCRKLLLKWSFHTALVSPSMDDFTVVYLKGRATNDLCLSQYMDMLRQRPIEDIEGVPRNGTDSFVSQHRGQ